MACPAHVAAAMAKPEVKALAASIGLQSVAEQKESMGICFIGKRKFGPFRKACAFWTTSISPGRGGGIRLDP